MKDPKATVRLKEEVLRRFKVKTAKNGTTIQAILEMAVIAYLIEKKPAEAKI